MRYGMCVCGVCVCECECMREGEEGRERKSEGVSVCVVCLVYDKCVMCALCIHSCMCVDTCICISKPFTISCKLFHFSQGLLYICDNRVWFWGFDV